MKSSPDASRDPIAIFLPAPVLARRSVEDELENQIRFRVTFRV
jgi:hypothetical protein